MAEERVGIQVDGEEQARWEQGRRGSLKSSGSSNKDNCQPGCPEGVAGWQERAGKDAFEDEETWFLTHSTSEWSQWDLPASVENARVWLCVSVHGREGRVRTEDGSKKTGQEAHTRSCVPVQGRGAGL